MKKCPKCEGEMEEGMLTPQTEGAFAPLLWAAGVKFAGLIAGKHTQTKTFKCKNCGYLESYAE